MKFFSNLKFDLKPVISKMNIVRKFGFYLVMKSEMMADVNQVSDFRF